MRLSVLLTCDPEIPVPPIGYGGIERIVEILIHGLITRGHEVVLCANAESKVPCELVAWRGGRSQHLPDILRNTATLTKTVLRRKFDIIHSFSRLAYMGLVMPTALPKIMSYQREPSVAQVKKAILLAAKYSLYFTGCSDYITRQIAPFAKAATIYNAALFDKYKLNETVLPDAPLVFLGRVEEIKGVHEAILVAQKKGRRLVIAGNVPHEGGHYFETKVKPYLDEQIEYKGPVNDAQKNELLGSAAALLMPIQWNEPFGIVMAEAMACGTPVIGLAKGAVPEIIENGVTGFSCETLENMLQAVDKIQTLDRSNVRQAAKLRFSENVMVENYMAFYQEVLNKRNK